jgi:hypothetical protein
LHVEATLTELNEDRDSALRIRDVDFEHAGRADDVGNTIELRFRQQERLRGSNRNTNEPSRRRRRAMTSFRQIQANRGNALTSTGPNTAEGKQRSRRNAVRHGLTAETVIATLEDAEDYKAFEAAIIADYDAQSAVERELVLRLAKPIVATAPSQCHGDRAL